MKKKERRIDMLELKKITKIYEVADLKQKALNEVSINFRACEFASILGQSGSGKTTLLNIVGGLDQYTSGDLIINGISTKEYNDRDWDSYRNHRVGFIFQSYNLISHQTILKNVELALTLSGVSKKERTERAKKALKEVGLEKHINKKPNQLSGGQMQRVAIARALINNPEIILADEPTGALDTATSKQIMDLLRKVAKDRLVIMVTHNPDLANEYSTRIIKLKDGKIVDDSNPYNGKDKEEKKEKTNKSKKTTMKFTTALGLSFNNLLTKKGRTILTSFAGSIGIIGIALILSLSNGFQNYIDKLQEDTLSSYPLTIASETMDFTSMMISMMEASKVEGVEEGKVVETQQFAKMFSSVTTNDLKSFKNYLETNEEKLSKDVKSVTYSYSIDPVIYTKQKGKIVQVNPNSIFSSLYGGSSIMSTFSSTSSVFVSYTEKEIEDLKKDYKVLDGKWPEKYDEMILVLPSENSIPDMVLYLTGMRDMEELYDIMSKIMTGEKVNITNKPLEFTYKDFLDLEYKLILKTDLYKYNSKYKIYEDMKDDKDFVEKLYEESLRLKVVGVIAPKNGGSSGMSGGLIYSDKLTEYIINESAKTDIVKKQLSNEEVDVFSNTRFDEKKKKTDLKFDDFITIDTKLLESAFQMKVSEKDIKNLTSGYITDISSSITTDTKPASDLLTKSLKTLAKGTLKYAYNNPSNKMQTPMGEFRLVASKDVDKLVKNYMKTKEATDILNKLEKEYVIPASVYNNAFKSVLSGLLTSYITVFNQMNSSLTTDPNNPVAIIDETQIDTTVNEFMNQTVIQATIAELAKNMTEAKMKSEVLTKVGELSGKLIANMAAGFNVDSNKIAKAFKFNLSDEELSRLMSAAISSEDSTAKSNLINLGYQNLEEPTSISIRFYSFDSKQNFLDVIDKYNEDAKKNKEEDKVLNFTDTTGILMSSVKKIVDSVSYVLIAFVSIALIVSSIMIGIITYISVLERTKEIGILRAIGASKKNISSIFNAETFIIGLLSGLIGIGFTVSVIPPINYVIHSVTNNYDINAALPVMAGIILIILSIILTLIGGLIPSKIASKKDPVEALRTE